MRIEYYSEKKKETKMVSTKKASIDLENGHFITVFESVSGPLRIAVFGKNGAKLMDQTVDSLIEELKGGK